MPRQLLEVPAIKFKKKPVIIIVYLGRTQNYIKANEVRWIDNFQSTTPFLRFANRHVHNCLSRIEVSFISSLKLHIRPSRVAGNRRVSAGPLPDLWATPIDPGLRPGWTEKPDRILYPSKDSSSGNKSFGVNTVAIDFSESVIALSFILLWFRKLVLLNNII